VSIKTLTGTTVTIAVQPSDTILSIKTRAADEIAKAEAKAAGKKPASTTAAAPADEKRPGTGSGAGSDAVGNASAGGAVSAATTPTDKQMRLVFRDKELEDGLTVGDYAELDKDAVLEMLPPKPQMGMSQFTFPDGSVYKGQWGLFDGKEKRRHGQGSWTRGNGDQYDGNWQSDKIHGQGKYVFGSGACYEGQLQSGKFHGQGSYKWPSGASYTGSWHENRMHGQGTFTTAAGHAFTGQFESDRYRNDKGQWVAPALTVEAVPKPQ